MTYSDCIINLKERKPGSHLTLVERGAIEHLKKLGYSNRAIARELNCSPATIGYELKRGTPEYSGHGRRPQYKARRGQAAYTEHRKKCFKPGRVSNRSRFIQWTVKMIRDQGWSFDVCVAYARLNRLFPDEPIPCTKTLYNMLWRGELPLSLFELPEALGRRQKGKPRIPKRLAGKSIDMRPENVARRKEFGHWESDTVIGKKRKGEPAVFSIVERTTGYYISLKISGKTTEGVSEAMAQLKGMYAEKFSQVFRSITTDNGTEFAAFSAFESDGTSIYFAHPYSAWERPVNERTNRLLRRYIPKGKSISHYSTDDVMAFADQINSIPRKRLGYRSPEELFDEMLDEIYRIQ